MVTAETRQDFVDLYLMKYFAKDDTIYDKMIEGVRCTTTHFMLAFLTPKTAPLMAFASPKVTAEDFLRNCKFFDDDYDELTRIKAVGFFKEMVCQFSNKERQLLLKFITGQSRLTQKIEIEVDNDFENGQYPMGHTCGWTLSMPPY